MIKLNEIFHSIQGEGTRVGSPCIFIRLTGCKLRCVYCDTKYAYYEGVDRDIDSILEEIRKFPCKLVQVTGGEPLEQKDCILLMQRLLEEGYEVLLETDGVEDISQVPAQVIVVMDVKTPGSKMASVKTAKNIPHLKSKDEVKFVICGVDDYEFSREYVQKYNLDRICTVIFSPALPQENLDWLAESILRDGLQVRFQLQLHKIIWGDKRGV